MAERGKPSEVELRNRLEAAAPLLEDTRTRYLALVPALLAWGWRQRLRGLADVAREVAFSDEAVEQALVRAKRRAQAEGWPEGGVRRLLEEVSAQRSRLCLVVERRLAQQGSLSEGLLALLGQVVGVPRKVPLGERDAAAQEALEGEPALISTLQLFGEAVEGLFGRPLARGQRLPFTLEEYDQLQALTPEGIRALREGWARVERIDTTGGVERELSRRAKRAPRGTRGVPGPRALVHATFWSRAAEAHVRTLLEERFSPLRLADSEQLAALRFLLARELDGAARLAEGGPRASLLMLAHELTASPEGRAVLVGGRAQVRAWAAAADALEGDEDWQRLRDGLRTLHGRAFRSALPPIYRVGKSVERAPSPERLRDFFSPEE